MMAGAKSQRFVIPCLSVLALFLFLSPSAFSSQEVGAGEENQEASMVQAQTTLASLFGRGATMPSVPHANGTIALPGFDNSTMTIDEGSLPGARKQKAGD